MKLTSLLLIGCSMLVACVAAAQDSNMYLFKFQGVYYSTNGAGRLVSTRVTERTLLQEKASAVNLTDLKGMAVVYHINGSDFGDTVEIVDTATGKVLDTLLGLYFSQAFSRVGITNSTDTEERRIEYLYTDQDSHSMGAASVRRTYLSPAKGTTGRRVNFQGHMEWVRVLAPAQGGSRMYSGNFRTTAPVTFK